jgi:hypothetical protein
LSWWKNANHCSHICGACVQLHDTKLLTHAGPVPAFNWLQCLRGGVQNSLGKSVECWGRSDQAHTHGLWLVLCSLGKVFKWALIRWWDQISKSVWHSPASSTALPEVWSLADTISSSPVGFIPQTATENPGFPAGASVLHTCNRTSCTLEGSQNPFTQYV